MLVSSMIQKAQFVPTHIPCSLFSPTGLSLIFFIEFTKYLEMKLVEKTVTLAVLLEMRSSVFGGSGGGKGRSVDRYHLLLLAFLRVTDAINMKTKTISDTERYLDVIRMLAQFSFSQALQLITDRRCMVLLPTLIRRWNLKRVFSKWRNFARSTTRKLVHIINPSDPLLKSNQSIFAHDQPNLRENDNFERLNFNNFYNSVNECKFNNGIPENRDKNRRSIMLGQLQEDGIPFNSLNFDQDDRFIKKNIDNYKNDPQSELRNLFNQLILQETTDPSHKSRAPIPRIDCEHNANYDFSSWTTDGKNNNFQHLYSDREDAQTLDRFYITSISPERDRKLEAMLASILIRKQTHLMIVSLSTWRSFLPLKHRLGNYNGLLKMQMINTLAPDDFESAKMAIREWRSMTCLKKHRKQCGSTIRRGSRRVRFDLSTTNQFNKEQQNMNENDSYLNFEKQRLKESFNAWKMRSSHWRDAPRVAILYDGIRLVKPTLLHWMGRSAHESFSSDRANGIYRNSVLTRVIDRWRSRHLYYSVRKRLFSHWRSIASFSRQTSTQSTLFHFKKLAAKSLRALRLRLQRKASLERILVHFKRKKEKRLVTFTMAVWTGMRRWIVRNSEKVQLLRAAKDAKGCMHLWRKWREMRQAADSVYKANLLRNSIDMWIYLLRDTLEQRNLAYNSLLVWRRVLKMRIALSSFYGSQYYGSRASSYPISHLPNLCQNLNHLGLENSKNSSGAIHGSRSMVCIAEKSIMILLMGHWRHFAALSRNAELLQVSKEKAIKLKIIRGWRADVSLTFYRSMQPKRTLLITINKMRNLAQIKRIKRTKMETEAAEMAAKKDFTKYLARFGRWQQAFQSRKMEEHLCEQRLIDVKKRHKEMIFSCWKLGTARSMLSRCNDFKECRVRFRIWFQRMNQAVIERNQRVLQRVLWSWRSRYRASVVNDLIKGKRRRQKIRAWLSWRRMARIQRDSHQNSVEFIGFNSVRYYLQRWRTEASIRRASKSKRSVVDLTPMFSHPDETSLAKSFVQGTQVHPGSNLSSSTTGTIMMSVINQRL